MRRLFVRLLLTVWALVTAFISLRLFTGNDVTDFRILRSSSSDPEDDDPVQRRRQLIRDHKARVLSGTNRSAGWTEYLRYASTGTRIWPYPGGDDEDRIVNQLHLVHADPAGQKLKKILVMSGFEGNLRPGQGRFTDHGCPVNQCTVTDRRDEAATADVILHKDYVTRPTQPRPPNQIWVLFMLESPMHTTSFDAYDEQVNWTATYRTDSVIVTPYERFAFYANYSGLLPERAPRNFAAGKTRKAAWFVSNCATPNGRFQYVNELKKYIDVDIYGACGTASCPRGSDECKKKLQNEYKFYLAFENSNCKDYITEKLYWNALENDVVPVVMGARPEDYARLAPPMSYIHVDDFESPKHLAEYLHQVDADDHLFNSYFRWRGTGEFIDTKFWCRLCALLHESQRTGRHVVYDRLDDWWRGDGVCVRPTNGVAWSSWRQTTTKRLNQTTTKTTKTHFRSWTEQDT